HKCLPGLGFCRFGSTLEEGLQAPSCGLGGGGLRRADGHVETPVTLELPWARNVTRIDGRRRREPDGEAGTRELDRGRIEATREGLHDHEIGEEQDLAGQRAVAVLDLVEDLADLVFVLDRRQ